MWHELKFCNCELVYKRVYIQIEGVLHDKKNRENQLNSCVMYVNNDDTINYNEMKT